AMPKASTTSVLASTSNASSARGLPRLPLAPATHIDSERPDSRSWCLWLCNAPMHRTVLPILRISKHYVDVRPPWPEQEGHRWGGPCRGSSQPIRASPPGVARHGARSSSGNRQRPSNSDFGHSELSRRKSSDQSQRLAFRRLEKLAFPSPVPTVSTPQRFALPR